MKLGTGRTVRAYKYNGCVGLEYKSQWVGDKAYYNVLTDVAYTDDDDVIEKLARDVDSTVSYLSHCELNGFCRGLGGTATETRAKFRVTQVGHEVR